MHLFPSVSEIMQAIHDQSTVFAKLDAILGYQQIPLDDEQKLDSFPSTVSRYRYTHGPMGLSSTGNKWCHRSDIVINDLPGCFEIVDYILNIVDLEQKDYSFNLLPISHKKITIGVRIKFAGFIASLGGITADTKNMAILDFPRPETVTDVRSFLGLANQLGNFVPDLAMVTVPLKHYL